MIIVGEQPVDSDHDKHPTEFFQVKRKHNLKLNKNKLQYKFKHACFFGVYFTSDDHKTENEDFKTINRVQQLTNVKALQCFLCMVNYVNKYSPRLAEPGDSLRDLPRKMYHLYRDLSILKYLMPSKNKLPVLPYSNIMTQENSPLIKHMQA